MHLPDILCVRTVREIFNGANIRTDYTIFPFFVAILFRSASLPPPFASLAATTFCARVTNFAVARYIPTETRKLADDAGVSSPRRKRSGEIPERFANRFVGCTWAKELIKDIVRIKSLRELPVRERVRVKERKKERGRKEGTRAANLIRRLDRICLSRAKNFLLSIVVRATDEMRRVYKCKGETDRAGVQRE